MGSRPRSFSWGVLAIAGALLCAPAGPSAQGRTHTAFVSVTDKAGVPVKDLTVADVIVREDNQAREVLKVAPATGPMRIALLIDNSQVTQSMTTEIRQGMGKLIDAIFKASPQSTMSIATFGDRPTPVQDFTNAAPVLIRAAQKTFAITGAGAYFMDAVSDAAKSLRKDPQPRQLIIAFVDENGEEFSNNSRQQTIEALRGSGAALWVVSVQGRGLASESMEARDRSAIVGDVSEQSGGTCLSLMNRLALPDKLAELAAMITNQVEITYGRPDQMIPPSKLEIQLTRKDLKLRAPRWTGK